MTENKEETVGGLDNPAFETTNNGLIPLRTIGVTRPDRILKKSTSDFFDNQTDRKISTSSLRDSGPFRKKSIMHKNTDNHQVSCDPHKDKSATKVPTIKESAKEISSHKSPDRMKIDLYKNTQYCKEVKEKGDEDRSWWYIFFSKCHDHQEGIPSWEPKFWSRVFPHPYFPTYRTCSRIVSLFLIGLFTWAVLYSILGDTAAPPDGQLYQLILLGVSAHIGGWLMGLTTLPALVGMFFVGVIFQNMNVVDIDESFVKINKNLSNISLVIVLTKAGLDLDPVALKRLKWTIMKLSVIPWITEASAVTVMAMYFLDMSWQYGLLLGTIIAAVAPAVVVPCLFRFRAKGYGVAKGIPTLIIAVASIGDATSVAVFGIIKGIVFPDPSTKNAPIFGPLSVVGGIIFGILWGALCNITPERNDPFVAPMRILLLLVGGMGAVFGSELFGYSGGGPLSCVALGFASIYFWSKNGWDVDDNPATVTYEIFWMICQPILFGITGARIRLGELDGNLCLIGLGIVVAGVLIRIIVTVILGIGSRLNLKEKIFVSIAWICKAIVQAALGPIALTMVQKDTVEYEYANQILTICIVSILLTAPAGAVLTSLLGPHLLTRTKIKTLKEIRRRKKSRRMSIRDIAITPEEMNEFSRETESPPPKHMSIWEEERE